MPRPLPRLHLGTEAGLSAAGAVAGYKSFQQA